MTSWWLHVLPPALMWLCVIANIAAWLLGGSWLVAFWSFIAAAYATLNYLNEKPTRIYITCLRKH